MPSEKYAARRGSVEDGMRMITACFARAPQRCTSRTYMHFLLTFQEVMLISKTRNQLIISSPCSLINTPQQAAGRLHSGAVSTCFGRTKWVAYAVSILGSPDLENCRSVFWQFPHD